MLKNEEAVSPVIGTLLMVALVVVLAATIIYLTLSYGTSLDNLKPQSARRSSKKRRRKRDR